MVRLALLLCCLGLVAASARAQEAGDPLAAALDAVRTDQFLYNVVWIEGDAGRQAGAGFIVGRQLEVVWIATAAHVAFRDFRRDVLVPAPQDGLRIHFHGQGGSLPVAGPPRLGRGDLAFIPVFRPPSQFGPDLWREQVIETHLETLAPARLAALPGAIGYGPADGRLQRTPEGGLELVEISGAEGQSGAPVVAGRGLVGMYYQSAGQRMIPIAEIAASARETEVPWRLAALPPPARPVRLCLTVDGAAPSQLRVNSDLGLRTPGPDGCADVLSGSVSLSAQDPTLRCEPRVLTLPATPTSQTLRAQCAANLSGIWNSSFGAVHIRRLGEGPWRAEGAPTLPGGWIAVSIVPVGATHQVSGHNQAGAMVFGEAEVTASRLRLRLQIGGLPRDLELVR